jgi:hypothetical protein
MRLSASVRCLAAVGGATVIFAGWGQTAAVAHGPCSCLSPMLIEPGDQVRLTGPDGRQAGGTGWPAYRVVFNPRPTDFGIAPSYLASAYRADAPTTTVLSRPRREPTRKGRFRVPKGTPPGLYMVLIWDGGEGGGHNSWGYLHVTDRDEPDGRGVVAEQNEPPDQRKTRMLEQTNRSEASGSQSSARWPLLTGVALGGLAVGIAGGVAAGRRRT